MPDSDYNVKTPRFVPYIFSEMELKRLFDSIDSVKPNPRTHSEMILPVIFRLELCCGMRPGEPLSLKTSGIDLKTGEIFIRKSKRGKDRHIIMSEDMRRLCEIYHAAADEREYFFPYSDHGKIPSRWARYQFNRAWMRSGLWAFGKTIPRPYDLRHYYTTREVNPQKKKQSIVAVSCKLLRVFFAIATKGCAYDAEKLLADIHRNQPAKAAA